MKLRITIPEGAEYPKWYGKAFYEYDKNDWHKVAYIIPLNIVVALYEKLRWTVKFKLWDRTAINMWNAAYSKGVEDGMRHGPGSSNGRTTDFEPENGGSIPSPGTNTTL